MKISKEIINNIEKEAKAFFVDASGCHDWTHVDRVRNLSLKISKDEGADLKVIEVAALLHDIARSEEMKEKGNFCHAERGFELAKDILKKYNLEKEDTDNILHCIIAHRYRNSHIPETIEAKVLYDADKLDSIGAIGVCRTNLFAGHSGSGTIYTGNEKKIAKNGRDHAFTKEDSAYLEYEFKLKKIKNKIITKTGRSIALERHEFMKKFFERMWDEVKGKK